MLCIRDLTKVFAPGTPNEHTALDHLDLSLAPGEFVTVIGSNGAGKSTLFSAIGGAFWADSGAIFLDGKNITYEPEHRRSAKIGRLFQDPMKGTAPHMTIEETWRCPIPAAGAGAFAWRCVEETGISSDPPWLNLEWGWKTGWIQKWAFYPAGRYRR